jgi:hypothetical protein
MRYLEALKLNHGSNSWMILSNLMTENRRDETAAPAMHSRMTALSTSLTLCSVDSESV